MPKSSLTYASAGVDYDQVDPLKVIAQQAAMSTSSNLKKYGMKEVESSRGESAYVVEYGDQFFAFVQEGLGTKNIVADAMHELTGKHYYTQIAQDTIAMMVNDIVTLGAMPVVISAYWAAGSGDWFDDRERVIQLAKSWGDICNDIGATWGGGETPILKDVIMPETIDLGGHCFGVIDSKKHLVREENINVGDAIVAFESSGIHANGLTLARKIAGEIEDGYLTELSDGNTYGEALLEPTIIYTNLIRALQENKIPINYIMNITGHGWRKIMRANKPYTYRINAIPKVPTVLEFIVEKGDMDIEEAYSSLNMGVGYAVIVSSEEVDKVLGISKKEGIAANVIGRVEEGDKQIIIEPLDLTLPGETLQVR